jgi:hypothetical protein
MKNTRLSKHFMLAEFLNQGKFMSGDSPLSSHVLQTAKDVLSCPATRRLNARNPAG